VADHVLADQVTQRDHGALDRDHGSTPVLVVQVDAVW
jgi:hypothetical protein